MFARNLLDNIFCSRKSLGNFFQLHKVNIHSSYNCMSLGKRFVLILSKICYRRAFIKQAVKKWNVTPLIWDFGGLQYIVVHCGSPSLPPPSPLFVSLSYSAPNLVYR